MYAFTKKELYTAIAFVRLIIVTWNNVVVAIAVGHVFFVCIGLNDSTTFTHSLSDSCALLSFALHLRLLVVIEYL